MKEYIVNSVKSDKAVLKPKKTYKGKKKKVTVHPDWVLHENTLSDLASSIIIQTPKPSFI